MSDDIEGDALVIPKVSPWENLRPGRPRKFNNPDDLWTAAVSYFEWVQDNPLYEMKAFANGSTARLPKIRAMTIDGLSTHLGIGASTWHDYAAREGFSDITSKVMQIIRNQKFEGAAADLLNANIIARDLGLADKSESTIDMGENTLAATLKAVRGD